MSSTPAVAASSLPIAQHGTPVRLTMEEYLRTSYHPDCDFVDGVLEERPLGEYEHGALQAFITSWFITRRREWNIRVATEWRNKVSGSRVRIPDVCVVEQTAPREQVGLTPPLICIEVRSPEDRFSRILRVFEDYRQMGVANIWLIDPIERTAMVYAEGGLKLLEGTRLTVDGTPIYMDLPEIFASLDE